MGKRHFIQGTPLERFNASYKVEDNGCWFWQKKPNSNGYGLLVVNGKKIRAHIWSYLHFVGDYDRKLDLDHTCHTSECEKTKKECPHRRCVNPAHLKPSTRKENAGRGNAGKYLANKTHCKRNHEFTPENTMRTKSGSRRCKECHRIESLDRIRRLREQDPERYKKMSKLNNEKQKKNKTGPYKSNKNAKRNG